MSYFSPISCVAPVPVSASVAPNLSLWFCGGPGSSPASLCALFEEMFAGRVAGVARSPTVIVFAHWSEGVHLPAADSTDSIYY